MPQVGIVISNYNGWQDTVRCLESLDKQTFRDFEIILLDDASTNDSVQQLGQHLTANTVFLPQRENTGFAAVNNLGMRRALADGCDWVLLLNNGRPLELCRLEPLADAILELWQPGIAGGKPAAGILSGRVNPSGKLSITFPYATGQVPIYYNRRRTSRPFMGFYQDITSDPMYEFAYGLSYSTFEYGDIREVCERPLTFEISVTNTSSRDGLETVHWFICDPVSTVTRPYKELKFFEKKLIRAGKTEQFRFEVDPLRDFGYVDESGRKYLEKGKYQILVKDKLFEVEL